MGRDGYLAWERTAGAATPGVSRQPRRGASRLPELRIGLGARSAATRRMAGMGRQREPRSTEREPRSSAGERADKTCRSCGRRIEWRAAWAKHWEDVAYCSDACRSRKVRPVDRELEASILRLIGERAATATICPSEAARAVAGAQRAEASGGGGPSDDATARGEPDDAWRALMEPARRAARRLVAAGEVEITQGGRVVDPSTAKGPIRVRRARGSAEA